MRASEAERGRSLDEPRTSGERSRREIRGRLDIPPRNGQDGSDDQGIGQDGVGDERPPNDEPHSVTAIVGTESVPMAIERIQCPRHAPGWSLRFSPRNRKGNYPRLDTPFDTHFSETRTAPLSTKP